MKKICSKLIFALTFVLLPQVVLSQGALYLSNLGESSSEGFIGGGSQNFQTGGASDGYILNSVTLLMGGYIAIASNYNVSVFSDNNGQAGISIGTLNGNADPKTAGQYVYSASGIILNSTTTYWIVASCDSSSSGVAFMPGGYIWMATPSPNYMFADGWKIDASGSDVILQFSVNATLVPEPSVYSLLALGYLIFHFCRSNDLRPKIQNR